MNQRPLLAITLGDPAGIGPEIVLKALQKADVWDYCRPLIIGSRSILERARGWVGGNALEIESVTTPAEGSYSPGVLTLLDLANADALQILPGRINAIAGRAAVEYVFRACDLALDKSVDAIVTGPLNKEAMHLAGYGFAGHTELLADRTRAKKVSMLLVGPQLKIIHVSTHIALKDAISRVTRSRVLEVIRLAHQSCQAFGIPQPRIAVAGLNPHAGESGLFGTEEADEIIPAIAAAKSEGLSADGPIAPDTVFLRTVKGAYDIVVAMYHDQGHIPMKLLAFDDGVNVSIGLPIIRTSVDHGTAFDIAGTGKANERSLLRALSVAAKMCGEKTPSNEAV